MFITFPADEKIKSRLDSVCKSLEISYEEWFKTALIESEFDVLVRSMVAPPEQDIWKWDTDSCQFIRRDHAE